MRHPVGERPAGWDVDSAPSYSTGSVERQDHGKPGSAPTRAMLERMRQMRFMLFMIPNIEEKDWMPDPEAVAAMTAYNEELTKAGVLLSLDGLHPTSKGARISGGGGHVTVS